MKALKNRVILMSALILFAFAISLVCTAAMAAGPPTEIKIGATVSMSGKFSTEVGPFKKLMEAYAAEINKVYKGDKYRPQNYLKEVQDFIGYQP